MSAAEELRAALARLTAGERQTLAVRWQQNSDHWEPVNRPLGRVWQVMTSLVLEVDRMEAMRAAGAEPHTMRGARRARR